MGRGSTGGRRGGAAKRGDARADRLRREAARRGATQRHPGGDADQAAAAVRPVSRSGYRQAIPDVALHPRDRGPVRAYVRDLVDARRHLLGLFMPAFGVWFISLLGPASDLQRYCLIGSSVLLAAMAVEAVLLGRSVVGAARAEFPGTRIDALSTGFYVFMRVHRPRRMRLPPPLVAPG